MKEEPYGVRACRGHWHVVLKLREGDEDIITPKGYNLTEPVALEEAAKMNFDAETVEEITGEVLETETEHYDKTGHPTFTHFPKAKAATGVKAQCAICGQAVLPALYATIECPYCGGSGQMRDDHRAEYPKEGVRIDTVYERPL